MCGSSVSSRRDNCYVIHFCYMNIFVVRLLSRRVLMHAPSLPEIGPVQSVISILQILIICLFR